MTDRAVQAAEKVVDRGTDYDRCSERWIWRGEPYATVEDVKAAIGEEVARVAALLRPVLDAEWNAACEACAVKMAQYLGSSGPELAAACRALKRGGSPQVPSA